MIEGIIYVAYTVVTVSIFVGFIRLTRMKRLFRRNQLLSGASMIDTMPSVSVCIPARNESHAMADCLDKVIASTYPKLEVIVLDDASGDGTSSLIKAYAHDGVRFVEGTLLQPGWLGKNHALNELLAEASGTYILFMDVDTRIAPDTIEQLVSYAEQEKAAMVSVLPRREDGVRSSTIFSPLRYFWALLFHTKTRPAVASSAWLVHRTHFLQQFTDFNTLKAVIQPEAAIAKALAASGRYRFLIGTQLLGVSYEKKWSSQRDTSVRLLFPLIGNTVGRSVAAIAGLLVLASPLFVTVYAVVTQSVLLVVTGSVVYIAGAACFGFYFGQVWRRGAVLAAILWPILVLQEAVMIVDSTVRYTQHRITWKGRAVAIETSTAR
jgi:glycosyltransferase involved in cell wall biosynthesis